MATIDHLLQSEKKPFLQLFADGTAFCVRSSYNNPGVCFLFISQALPDLANPVLPACLGGIHGTVGPFDKN